MIFNSLAKNMFKIFQLKEVIFLFLVCSLSLEKDKIFQLNLIISLCLFCRSFQNYISNADPNTLAALNAGKSGEFSPEMIKTASNMIAKMSPEELQRMVQLASSFQSENENFPRGSLDSSFGSFGTGSVPPNITPEMLKTATDVMNNMPMEERQKMFEMASSLRARDSVSNPASLNTDGPSSDFPEARESSAVNGRSESSSDGAFSNLRSGSQSSFAASTADMQEQMRNQMKDPAMRQVCLSRSYHCYALSLQMLMSFTLYLLDMKNCLL